MTLYEMLAGGGGALAILLTLIQVTPIIKWNPWSAIARGIGKAINAELYAKMERLEKEIKETRQTVIDLNNVCDERNATLNRTHILHFNDELLHKIDHTKEHFDQILEDIDNYDDYCSEHPLYKNNKAASAINNIQRTYNECMKKNSFL